MHGRLFLFSFILLFFTNTVSAQQNTDTTLPDSLFISGLRLAKKGENRRSIADFRKALELYQAIDATSADVGETYMYIGTVEKRRAKHDAAVDNYEKAKVILMQDPDKNAKRIIGLYMGIGSSHRYLRNYNRSLQYYFEGVDIAVEKFGEKYFRVGQLYSNIATVYEEIGDLDNAILYFGKSKDILEQEAEPRDLSQIYNNYGDLFLKQDRFDEARRYFEKAVAVQEDITDNRSPHYIIALTNLGDVYVAQNQPEKAVPHYETALDICGLGSLDAKDFPAVNTPEDCLRVMAALGKVNNLLYERTAREPYLIASRKVLKCAVDYVEYLKADFKDSGAREVLLSNSFPVYEQMIAIAVNTPQAHKENLKEAFAYSELSRNNLLREAVQDAKAKKFAGIPDSLLVIEQNIKTELAELKKQQYDAEKSDATDTEKLLTIEQNILSAKNRKAALADTFALHYPDYFALKYATNTVSVEEIQENILQPEQGMLEYFVGKDFIFAFLITSAELRIFQTDKNFSLQDTVQAMRRSIYDWRPTADDAEKNLQTYRRTAFFLYDRIVRPFENDLPDKLIIMPGGVLGYLPFEALLTEKPLSGDAFSQYKYWIKDKQISYAYSATLLKEMLSNTNTGREVLGFAPGFGEYNRDSVPDNLPDLKELKYNVREVTAIQKMLGGRVFTGDDATLQSFLEIAPLYKILHLATHGKANDEADEYSYLAFTYILDSLDNELLYAGNLYNTRLRADMVVLSACETGIGDLRQGEGILSLARGFSYAGAKSIVTTLWSIDDKSSLDIMVKFYENLNNGERKDEALRGAKLDFIYDNNRRAHPLFWAAYIPIGNMETIALGREQYRYWYFAAGGIFMIAAFWFFKERLHS